MPLVFDLMFKQKKVTGNSFSFYLTKIASEEGSALVLGGVNKNYAITDFKYYPVIKKFYWQLTMTDIVFNGTSYKQPGVDLTGIIDTGTSVIVGPTKVVEEMTKGFGKGKEKQVDCNLIPTFPNLVFTFGQDKYTMKPEEYILKVNEFGQTVCIVGIMGLDLDPKMGEAFILGDSFIKVYYTHFDVAGQRVGFSKAI
jgi:cathepsin D